MTDHILSLGFKKIDGILLDLGTSSMQLDSAERGFSFQYDAPLDMRMNQTGQSAYDIVNSLSENSLADIIYYYGEERSSRKIAKAIVNERKSKNKTTFDLNKIILNVKKQIIKKYIPSTKTFQALRIHINNELKDLYNALISAEKVLSEKGKLIVISFHSLEDRIVKNFIRENSVSLKKYNSRETEKTFVYESRKVLKPTEEEIKKTVDQDQQNLDGFLGLSTLSKLNSSHNFSNYGGVNAKIISLLSLFIFL